jgi:DNA-binding winged helix-turn-helix (wHTH) protein
MRLHFDGWLYDGDRRQLFQPGGAAVHLTPKAFDLLGALLSRRPRAVSKAELRDILWPDSVVSEANLPSLAAELRRALGDDAGRPRYVRTVPRFGYAFCGAAADALEPGPAAPRSVSCRVVWKNREIELAPGENVLGRAPEAAVWVDHASVSRRHARIVVSPEGALLEDLGSKNGTFIARRRVERAAALADGDQIFLGSAPLEFRAVRAASTETTPGA